MTQLNGPNSSQEVTSARVTERSSWPKRLLGFAAGYVVIFFVLLPEFVPPVPRTLTGWIFLALAAPPLYLLGEGLFEFLSSPSRTRVGRVLKTIGMIVLILLYVGTLLLYIVTRA